MAISEKNDLVSSICIVKILYKEFLRYALFLQNVFCICMHKNLEPYDFLWASTPTAHNISGLAAIYKIFGTLTKK